MFRSFPLVSEHSRRHSPRFMHWLARASPFLVPTPAPTPESDASYSYKSLLVGDHSRAGKFPYSLSLKV